MKRVLVSAALVSLSVAPVIVNAAGKGPCKHSCGTNINDKGDHTGDGLTPTDLLIAPSGKLAWGFTHRIHKKPLTIELRNFKRTAGSGGDCPGLFTVDGVVALPAGQTCGATMEFTKEGGHSVDLTNGAAGHYQFTVTIDNHDGSKPEEIDPELEIDTSGADNNVFSLLLSALAGFVVALGVFFTLLKLKLIGSNTGPQNRSGG